MKQLGLVIPQSSRFDFSQPRGKLVSGELSNYLELYEWKKIICVGDVVTNYCLKSKRIPDIIIIDGKTLRTKEGFSLSQELLNTYKIIKIENQAGILTYDNLEIICNLLQRETEEKYVIFVDGEEDILAMPCLACAPDQSLIIYGIPNKGAALVHVNNYIRRELQNKLLTLKINF